MESYISSINTLRSEEEILKYLLLFSSHVRLLNFKIVRVFVRLWVMLQVRCESYEFVLVCTLVVTVYLFCQNQVVVKVVLFWSI